MSSAIAKWCELDVRVRIERVGVVGAALGDVAGDLPERLLTLVAEAEFDDRLVARPVVEVLLGVLDVRARQARVVAHDPEPVRRRRLRVALLVAQDEHARLDLDDLRARLLRGAEALERSLARLVGQAVVERLLGDLVKGVEARAGRGLAVLRHRDLALRRLLDRVVKTGDRLLTAVDLRRIGLAALVEDVLLPVVEEQLRRRADLLRGALGVLDARQVDLDLILARPVELGLGDAERVDAVAHDVQRALQRLCGDLRLLGRLALIDEPDAALEVEPELRRVREENRHRTRDQPEDDQQDQQVAAALGHAKYSGETSSTACARRGARCHAPLALPFDRPRLEESGADDGRPDRHRPGHGHAGF